MEKKPDEFFLLIEPYEEISSSDDFWSLVSDVDKRKIENKLFRPDQLTSKKPPMKWEIRKKTFFNVSFKETQLTHIEFTDCQFDRCLFIGSKITDCRFNNCSFTQSNFFRAEITRCFIDPTSFKRCVDSSKYANVGLGLYQELLQNSRQQAQPDFTREAQYQFARWQRYLKWNDIKDSNSGWLCKRLRYLWLLPAWVFEKTTGSGMRLWNLTVTSAVALAGFTLINYFFRSSFGLSLKSEPVTSFVEAFYFSTIVVTSLGFGDITPSTWIGQLAIASEAIIGFLIFATLLSMIFRRITS